MHYYIDGYNLLFRLMDSDKTFQDMREELIEEINNKVALVKIDVTLVFDAHFQIGHGSRSHYDSIEILFTSEGQTADDFIIAALKRSLKPEKEILITSDKKLALRAKHKFVKTQSVEEFIDLLNRRYRNKLKPPKPKPAARKLVPLIKPKEKSAEPDTNASTEECIDYYEKVFQTAFDKIIWDETPKKKPAPPKRKPKQPKKSPFPEEKSKWDI